MLAADTQLCLLIGYLILSLHYQVNLTYNYHIWLNKDMQHAYEFFIGTIKLLTSAPCISKTTVPIFIKFTYFMLYIRDCTCKNLAFSHMNFGLFFKF